MGFKPIYLIASELRNEIKARTHAPEFPTGFQELDDLIWGLRRQDIIIVAGRTSHGKSDFIINMAWNLAEAGKPVWMMPLEMSAKAVVERLFSRDSRIPNTELQRGRWDDDAERKYTVFLEKLKSYPIEIYDGYAMTTDKIIKVIDDYKPEIIFIDHGQMISSEGKKNKKEALDDMMRQLKVIALERNVIIIIGSQFNRSSSENSSIENLKGCVHPNTIVGKRTIYSHFHSNIKTPIPTIDLEIGLKTDVVPSRVIDSGMKRCLKIKTRSGKEIILSRDTKMFDGEKWKKASQFKVREKIQVDN